MQSGWISLGAIHKGCLHVRGEGGQTKVDKCGQEERGWLAKCGRPLGKEIIATVFVKFTQIIWQYVYI